MLRFRVSCELDRSKLLGSNFPTVDSSVNLGLRRWDSARSRASHLGLKFRVPQEGLPKQVTLLLSAAAPMYNITETRPQCVLTLNPKPGTPLNPKP